MNQLVPLNFLFEKTTLQYFNLPMFDLEINQLNLCALLRISAAAHASVNLSGDDNYTKFRTHVPSAVRPEMTGKSLHVIYEQNKMFVFRLVEGSTCPPYVHNYSRAEYRSGRKLQLNASTAQFQWPIWSKMYRDRRPQSSFRRPSPLLLSNPCTSEIQSDELRYFRVHPMRR